MESGDHGQGDVALSAVSAAALFPGRLSLRVDEVARVLSISPNHVVDLLQSGELAGEDVARRGEATNAKTPRANWRVPVAAFDAFVARRKNR